MLAGPPEPHAGFRPPGCQGCRVNKAAHREQGREPTGRQEGEQVSQEPGRHKGPLVSSSWPQGAALPLPPLRPAPSPVTRSAWGAVLQPPALPCISALPETEVRPVWVR